MMQYEVLCQIDLIRPILVPRHAWMFKVAKNASVKKRENIFLMVFETNRQLITFFRHYLLVLIQRII